MILGLGFAVAAQAQTEAPAEVVATPAVEQVPAKKCCKGGDATAACQGQAQAEGTAAAPKKSCCQSSAAASGSCQGHAQASAEAAAPAAPASCQGHAQAASGTCQGHAQAEASTTEAPATEAAATPACQGSSETKPCCKKKPN